MKRAYGAVLLAAGLALGADALTAQIGARGAARGGGVRGPGAGGIPSLTSTGPPGLGSARGRAAAPRGRPDARLGAGGIRPRGGNIVTPGIVSPGLPPRPGGDILRPGTPPGLSGQPRDPGAGLPPARVRVGDGDRFRDFDRDFDPDFDPDDFDFGFGRRRRGFPFFWGLPLGTSYYVPNVINIPSYVATQSQVSRYIVPADDPPQAHQRAEPKVFEVDPNTGRSVEDGAPSEGSEEQVVLVALKGGLVYASTQYWGEGETLHFTTVLGDTYVVPLHEVDLEMTTQLNRERDVPFAIEFR